MCFLTRLFHTDPLNVRHVPSLSPRKLYPFRETPCCALSRRSSASHPPRPLHTDRPTTGGEAGHICSTGGVYHALFQRVREAENLLLVWRDSKNIMATPEGLEPPTYWFEANRSIQLSYGVSIWILLRLKCFKPDKQ